MTTRVCVAGRGSGYLGGHSPSTWVRPPVAGLLLPDKGPLDGGSSHVSVAVGPRFRTALTSVYRLSGYSLVSTESGEILFCTSKDIRSD